MSATLIGCLKDWPNGDRNLHFHFIPLSHVGVDRANGVPATSAGFAISAPKCLLSKYGFRASEVRTRASVDRAETGLLHGFLSSVPKRPSQEVQRKMASGERFLPVSAPRQSTGLPQKPQETCHSAWCRVWRRVWLVYELAEEVRPDTNGLHVGSSRPTKTELGNAGFLPARRTACLCK